MVACRGDKTDIETTTENDTINSTSFFTEDENDNKYIGESQDTANGKEITSKTEKNVTSGVSNVTKEEIEHKYVNGICEDCYKTKIGLNLGSTYYWVKNDSSSDSRINTFIFDKSGSFYISGAYGTSWENYPGCPTIVYNGKTYYRGDIGGPSRKFVIKENEILVYHVDSTTDIELKLIVNKKGDLEITYSSNQVFDVGHIWLSGIN